MWNRRFKRRVVALSILGVVVLAGVARGLLMIASRGEWPADWPEELEPYRQEARTVEFAAGTHETAYEIMFDTREAFERIWPVILKLKSEGAPLTLLSVDEPGGGGSAGSLTSNASPRVRILGPSEGGCQKRGGPMLHAGPPWPESAFLADGTLPKYVAPSWDGSTWEPVDDERAGRCFSRHRARVEIVLVTDGKIIDLNRIRLPADTLIIDKRKLDEPPGAATQPASISD